MSTKTLIKATSAFVFSLALISCISTDHKKPSAEVRDVPYQARGSTDPSLRKRVMVLPFLDTDASRDKMPTREAREKLVHAMLRTDDFVLVNPGDFPKDVNQFVKNGEYDFASMAKLGEDIGLSAFVEGKVIDVKTTRVGDEVGLVRKIRVRVDATVQIRMVATKNGQVLINEMRNATIEDSTTRVAQRAYGDRYLEQDPALIEAALTKGFLSFVPQFSQTLEKLSWEGRVALIKGERIYLNAGRLSGLQIGDILKVMEEGEDVYDPETGALIGRVPGRLKGTIEVVSYFGKDGSIGIIHSGAGFKENDIVELY